MEEIKQEQEKIWFTVFEENYPFMRSLIERTVGELRYKDFVDCMDLVVDLAVSKEREKNVEIVKSATPQHVTREYRDTDKMRDDIINLINTK